MPRWRNW